MTGTEAPAGWFRRRGRPDELAALRAELAEALERAARAEQELGAVRAAAAEEPDGDDFGVPAEQILRLAESQARQTRRSAARDASALLERTHAEAESHRRAVADELAARSRELDRKAADREAALDAREQELVEASEADRRDIKRLHRVAVAEADRIRAAARAAADDIHRRVASEAAAELGRLRGGARPGEPTMLRTMALDPGDDPQGSGPQG